MTTKATPLPPPELAASASLSDSEPAIIFAFGGTEAVATAFGTPILRLPFSPGVIYSSSWDLHTHHNPHPRPPVPVPTNTRLTWG